MIDPIKKFEQIQETNKSVFKDINELFGIGDSKEKRNFRNLAKKAKKGKLTPEEAGQFIKLQKSLTEPEELKKYKKSIENGDECGAFGTKPNNKFWSEVGSKNVQLGQFGKVDDISGFNLSKRELRCYDVENDPRNIGWLFNGVYEAEKIWGTTGKVYFKGIWKGGDFKGVMTPESTFEGGNFKGQWLQKQANTQTPEEKQKTQFKPGFKTISFKNVPGLEIENLLLEILDENEFKVYDKILKDVKNGNFSNYIKRIKRLIVSGKLDGFGNIPALNYLFPTQGTNAIKLEQDEVALVNYLLYIKTLISTFSKKDSSPNVYYQKVFIDRLKKIIGIKPIIKVQQKKAPKKVVKKVTAENKLSVKGELLKIINS